MKTYFFAFLFMTALLPATSFSQFKLPKILSKGSGSGLSEGEAGQGIKRGADTRCERSA